MKQIVLWIIALYGGVSFFLQQIFQTVFGFSSSCQFTPTCSEYMTQAIEKYGVAKGLRLGLRRIVRCHPFAKGGHDPVI